MLTQARQNSVTDNESCNDESKQLNQWTGIGQDSKDWVAWTCIWLPKRIARKFKDRPFFGRFRNASGFEVCKTSPPAQNVGFTRKSFADSNEQNGRRDNIRNFVVEEIKDEDVF